MHVCTVVEPRRLAWARALVSDVHRLHPGSTCTVMVLDETRSPAHEVQGAEVLLPTDIDGPDLARMALLYGPRELAAALRPWLMRAVLDRREAPDHVVVLDPQVVLLQPLDDLPRWCAEDSVVLTVRSRAPTPRDGRRPHEQDLLLTGQYDVALVGVGATAQGRAMLDWWAQRTATSAFDFPADGLYLDQRWLDLVPGLFEHRLVTDPTWNVGETTLGDRQVRRSDDGTVVVGERPVRFLGVRGYSVRVPHLLDADRDGPARTLLSEHPVLREELDRHRARLLELDPDVDLVPAAPPYARRDGVVVDTVVRRLVRAEAARSAAGAPERPGPWDLPLATWLATPDDEGSLPALGRYLATVYADRGDLQGAFPEVVRGDPTRFHTWTERFGRRELGPTLDAVLTYSSGESPATGGTLLSRAPTPPRGTRPQSAVEVVGYLTAELGQGESARQFVAGLELAGVAVATSTYTRLSSRRGVPWTDRLPPEGERPDTMLLCVSPEALPALVRDLGPGSLKNRYRIGLWFWELTDFPDRLLPSVELVDEIWVASDFNARTLRGVTDKPVVVMPHPAHPPAYSATRVPELPDDDVPTFLFVFDYLSILERKNPMATVAAFVRAFPEPGTARLVIKSINGERTQLDRERLRYLVTGRDDIVLIERYLTREELDGLMHGATAYVSLHRSEGFGQTLAESMAIGKPVIATAYSGNMEFTRPDNSYLVPASMTPVPPGNAPYLPPSQWGDPDVDAAARAMLSVVADPEEAARRGARARQTIEEEFSVGALSRAISERWAALTRERSTARQPGPGTDAARGRFGRRGPRRRRG